MEQANVFWYLSRHRIEKKRHNFYCELNEWSKLRKKKSLNNNNEKKKKPNQLKWSEMYVLMVKSIEIGAQMLKQQQKLIEMLKRYKITHTHTHNKKIAVQNERANR